jgi:hypothetical protein
MVVAVAPERLRRLREHLVRTLRELRAAKYLECLAVPVRPEAMHRMVPLYCRNSEDDAFRDEASLARVRLANPNLHHVRGL